MRWRISFFFFLVTSIWAANDHPAFVAGVYEGRQPVVRASARIMTLHLEQDGSAVLVADTPGHGKAESKGTWTSDGKDVTLVLTSGDNMTGAAPLVWRWKKDRLTPQQWDQAKYGKKGLALRRPR